MNNNKPIFHNIFGADWDNLPIVFKKHYANSPYSNDIHTANGQMFVKTSSYVLLFKPILKLFGSLIIHDGGGIKAQIQYLSDEKSKNLTINRTLYLTGGEVYQFRSSLEIVKNNEIIEYMRYGIGWRCKYIYNENRVDLIHRGYVLKIFNFNLPLPLSIIFGKISAHEDALSDDEFYMEMIIKNYFFGNIYSYGGYFKMATFFNE